MYALFSYSMCCKTLKMKFERNLRMSAVWWGWRGKAYNIRPKEKRACEEDTEYKEDSTSTHKNWHGILNEWWIWWWHVHGISWQPGERLPPNKLSWSILIFYNESAAIHAVSYFLFIQFLSSWINMLFCLHPPNPHQRNSTFPYRYIFRSLSQAPKNWTK